MSYQEIYMGLNKRASARQLARVIGMRKRAGLPLGFPTYSQWQPEKLIKTYQTPSLATPGKIFHVERDVANPQVMDRINDVMARLKDRKGAERVSSEAQARLQRLIYRSRWGQPLWMKVHKEGPVSPGKVTVSPSQVTAPSKITVTPQQVAAKKLIVTPTEVANASPTPKAALTTPASLGTPTSTAAPVTSTAPKTPIPKQLPANFRELPIAEKLRVWKQVFGQDPTKSWGANATAGGWTAQGKPIVDGKVVQGAKPFSSPAGTSVKPAVNPQNISFNSKAPNTANFSVSGKPAATTGGFSVPGGTVPRGKTIIPGKAPSQYSFVRQPLQKLPGRGARVWNFVKGHPKSSILTALLLTGTLAAGSYALGSSGKSDLSNQLYNANTTLNKVKAQNTKLKQGTGSFWEDVIAAIARWWERISKYFRTNTNTTTQGSK